MDVVSTHRFYRTVSGLRSLRGFVGDPLGPVRLGRYVDLGNRAGKARAAASQVADVYGHVRLLKGAASGCRSAARMPST